MKCTISSLDVELLVFGWVITACYLALKISNELRKVYCCFGLFRSPLHSWIKGRYQLLVSTRVFYKRIETKGKYYPQIRFQVVMTALTLEEQDY